MMDREPNYKSLPIWVRAARTIYLNKSCFNGLYRVNSKGYFNVPFGKKEKINTYDKDNMEIIHYYFKTNDVTILNGDFAKAVENAKAGDFVYFDPPYDPLENKNSFTSYSKDSFTRDDQERLANLFMELSKKGVYVMLSNHNTSLIKELYKDYNIHIVHAKRVINSDSNGRGDVEEVIVTNY
ncbi:MAG: Dam family site-specific DNA-(adenine-N6)-methyltransferase [Candidatus Hydrothermia bacterium]